VDDKDYQIPFAFTGKLDKLTITVDRPKLSAEDEKRLMEASQQADDGPTMSIPIAR
jgi:arylsulfatase